VSDVNPTLFFLHSDVVISFWICCGWSAGLTSIVGVSEYTLSGLLYEFLDSIGPTGRLVRNG
jgi:hypothetical protein